MILHVESRLGHDGDIEPVAFRLGVRRLGVLRIVDRWLSTDSDYFKIEVDDASTCILKHIHAQQEWELTLYQSPRTRSDDPSRD